MVRESPLSALPRHGCMGAMGYTGRKPEHRDLDLEVLCWLLVANERMRLWRCERDEVVATQLDPGAVVGLTAFYLRCAHAFLAHMYSANRAR